MDTAIHEKYVREKLVKRPKDSNKGDFGKLLMICGSYGMVGAAIMAGKAALRSGVGLLNMVVDENCYPLIAPSLPEAVFTVIDMDKKYESEEKIIKALSKSTACAVGCGLSLNADFFMPILINHCKVPLLIDADGLNFLSGNLKRIYDFSCELAVTPHPGEMSRLIHKDIYKIQENREEVALKFSEKYEVNLLLKGYKTVIVSKGLEVFINPTGNSGMAKGGSGDVLSGIIASFLAQGMNITDSLICGAYIHGLAGDEAAKIFSKQSMLATDIIKFLPKVFLSFENNVD